MARVANLVANWPARICGEDNDEALGQQHCRGCVWFKSRSTDHFGSDGESKDAQGSCDWRLSAAKWRLRARPIRGCRLLPKASLISPLQHSWSNVQPTRFFGSIDGWYGIYANGEIKALTYPNPNLRLAPKMVVLPSLFDSQAKQMGLHDERSLMWSRCQCR